MSAATALKSNIMLPPLTPLWLDDQIDHFGGIQRRLIDLGDEPVVSSNSPYSFEKEVAEKDDLANHRRFIVDNKYGAIDRREGTRFALERLEFKDNRVVVFSAFQDSARKVEPVVVSYENDSAVLFLRKSPVEVGQTDSYFHQLGNCIHEFFHNPIETLKHIEIPSIEADSEIIELGYSDFEKLPLREKKKLYDEFRTGCGVEVNRLFAEGALWVFYAGSQTEPYRVAWSRDEIMSHAEVATICSELDCLPFVFRQDVRVDTTGCANGSNSEAPGAGYFNYPVARIGFDCEHTILGREFDFHFDTGSDFTILCDDFLEAIGATKENRVTFGDLLLHGTTHLAEIIELDVVLVNPAAAGDRPSKSGHVMAALTVEGWSNSGMREECGASCKVGRTGAICKRREYGLLGRTTYIGRDQVFDVGIDGLTARISFKGRREVS
jgi:hypothetical protein